jgi:hypothetical protein
MLMCHIYLDLLVNMDDLTFAQKAELNLNGTKYGLEGGEFMEFLNADLEEKEQMRLAKLQEEEKQAMSVCSFIIDECEENLKTSSRL